MTDGLALRVMINSVVVPGAISLLTEHVCHLAAARFEVEFSTAGLPGQLAYFASLTGGRIEIAVAPDGMSFVSLLTGTIDNVTLDFRAKTATVSGRDLAALLIDTAAAGAFANQTSSQIAQTVAERHGLVANITRTTTPVGQYYELEHTRTVLVSFGRSENEWSLLGELALLEGFNLSVTGETLNFCEPLAAIVPVSIVFGRDLMSLTIDSAFGVPGQVVVTSWNTRTKTAVTASSGDGVSTTIVKPNLVSARAEQLASSMSMATAAHRVALEAALPGETRFVPGQTVVLSGTGTSLDGYYVLDSVIREIGANRGFSEVIRAHATTQA